jgi:integrase/recombinase XerD
MADRDDDLDEATVARLLAATSGDTIERRRDAVCVALLYFAGLKASEAISLDLSDVAFDGAVITIDRDGPHERVLPAVPALQVALGRWIDPAGRARLRPSTDAVLVNRRGNRLTRQGLWLVTGAVADRTGIGDSLSPNALRRACAAHLAEKGLPAAAIAAFLGHTQRQAPGAGILTGAGWGSCNLNA